MSDQPQIKRPDWGTLLLAVSVVLALYAAIIHPVEVENERLRLVAAELAKAVLVQNDKISRLEGMVERNGTGILTFDKRLEEINHSIMDLKTTGTTGSDRRLTLLEYRVTELEKHRP